MKHIHWFNIKLYGSNKLVNKVAEIIINEDDWEMEEDYHNAVLENKKYKISFWNCNKWYGWFSEGTIENKDNNKVFYWGDEMPIRKLINKLIDKIVEIRLKGLKEEKIK